MANSKCPKCDNAHFEVAENSPSKSKYKLMFIQCSKCGSVVGTMDYWNIGILLKELEGKVGLGSYTSAITKNFAIINQNIATLFEQIQIANSKLKEIEDKIKN